MRLAKPGAICDAPSEARTFETTEEFYDEESVFEENVSDVISECLAIHGLSRIPRYGEFKESKG